MRRGLALYVLRSGRHAIAVGGGERSIRARFDDEVEKKGRQLPQWSSVLCRAASRWVNKLGGKEGGRREKTVDAKLAGVQSTLVGVSEHTASFFPSSVILW